MNDPYSEAQVIKALRRDWVHEWPRLLPYRCEAYRRGFQNGVNRALGKDARADIDVPKINPYLSHKSKHDSWALGDKEGYDMATQQLAHARANSENTAHPGGPHS